MSEPGFDRRYFHQEVIALRERFGTLAFWKDPESAARARKALAYVYLRTSGAKPYDQILFEATLDELARREFLILSRFSEG